MDNMACLQESENGRLFVLGLIVCVGRLNGSLIGAVLKANRQVYILEVGREWFKDEGGCWRLGVFRVSLPKRECGGRIG